MAPLADHTGELVLRRCRFPLRVDEIEVQRDVETEVGLRHEERFAVVAVLGQVEPALAVRADVLDAVAVELGGAVACLELGELGVAESEDETPLFPACLQFGHDFPTPPDLNVGLWRAQV